MLSGKGLLTDSFARRLLFARAVMWRDDCQWPLWADGDLDGKSLLNVPCRECARAEDRVCLES